MFDRLHSNEDLYSGRLLLLLGESEVGKTHLLQTFCNYTHENDLGYAGYIKITSETPNYSLYILNQLLDSLSKTYHLSDQETSGFMRLSNSLVQNPQLGTESIKMIRAAKLTPRHLAALVHNVAIRLVKQERFRGQDVDLIQALIYLQRNDSSIRTSILKYLRCQHLSISDSQILGGLLKSRLQDDDPEYLLQSLARLIYMLDGGALVVCLDQLEEISDFSEPETYYQKAIQAVITLAQQPNVIVVITCDHGTFETSIRKALPGFYLELLEKNPEKIILKPSLNSTEIKALISLRLKELFSSKDILLDKENPIYPFPKATPQYLENNSISYVLDWCNKKQQESIQTGQAPILDGYVDPESINKPLTSESILQLWDDHLIKLTDVIIEDEETILGLLVWALEQYCKEINDNLSISNKQHDQHLDLDILTPNGELQDQLHLRICNKRASGGALAKQIKELKELSQDRIAVAIRSSNFPNNPKTKIAKIIDKFLSDGGRCVVIKNADLQIIQALQSFLSKHKNHPELGAWQQSGSSTL